MSIKTTNIVELTTRKYPKNPSELFGLIHQDFIGIPIKNNTLTELKSIIIEYLSFFNQQGFIASVPRIDVFQDEIDMKLIHIKANGDDLELWLNDNFIE